MLPVVLLLFLLGTISGPQFIINPVSSRSSSLSVSTACDKERDLLGLQTMGDHFTRREFRNYYNSLAYYFALQKEQQRQSRRSSSCRGQPTTTQWIDGCSTRDSDDDGWLLFSEKGCWRSILKMIHLIRKSLRNRWRRHASMPPDSSSSSPPSSSCGTIKINYMADRAGEQKVLP